MLVVQIRPAEFLLEKAFLAADHDKTDKDAGRNGHDQKPVEREGESRSGQRDPEAEIARIARPCVSAVRHENGCRPPRLAITQMPLHRTISGNTEPETTGCDDA